MSSKKRENNQKKKVALIGCGLIGQSWAISFLSAGFEVSLFDPVEGVTVQSKEKIKAKLKDLQNYGLLKNKNISDFLDKIHLARDIPQAVVDSFYVQESGPEDLDVKKALTKKNRLRNTRQHPHCQLNLWNSCIFVCKRCKREI